MSDAQVPDHAHVVVVPLSNPDTAPDLLRLARAVVRSDGGKVIALVVVVGDAEAEGELDKIEAVTQTVETFRARDGQVDTEVVTRPASSVARGILDATREEGADMVVLGVQAPTPGSVAIGGVTEQVIETAECDVLVYRRAQGDLDLSAVTNVAIGVNSDEDAPTVARLGILVGLGLGQPVEVVHVRGPRESHEQAALTLHEAISAVDGERECRRSVVEGPDPIIGIRSHVSRTTLTVIGFRAAADLTGNRLGGTVRGVMDTMRGPVLAISRPRRDVGASAVLARVVKLLRPRLTEAEEQSLVWHARLAATTNSDFIVLSVVASMLATFGLILNSGAVIIGAMLVAPLMGPLVAFGTALVDGEVRTLRRAGTTVGIGSVLVAGTAVLIGLIAGPETATPEMLSRGQPSLIDAGVAVASGVVGGYAGARKGIPAALAGVAIAAALVPPICVFGLALSSDLRLAAGAGLLFLTNIACIAAASAGVLLWLGVRLARKGQSRRRYVSFTVPVLAAVFLSLILFGLTVTSPDLGHVRSIVEAGMSGIEVVSVDDSGPPDTVTVTVRTARSLSPEEVQEVADEVAEAMPGTTLRMAVQQLVVGGG